MTEGPIPPFAFPETEAEWLSDHGMPELVEYAREAVELFPAINELAPQRDEMRKIAKAFRKFADLADNASPSSLSVIQGAVPSWRLRAMFDPLSDRGKVADALDTLMSRRGRPPENNARQWLIDQIVVRYVEVTRRVPKEYDRDSPAWDIGKRALIEATGTDQGFRHLFAASVALVRPPD